MESKPYVNFNTAKLLKEKGFNEPCSAIYSAMVGEEGKLVPITSSINQLMEFYKKGHKFFDDSPEVRQKNIQDCISNSYAQNTITAPEQWQVIEWFRVNHGIWIEITMGKDHSDIWFDYDIFSTIQPRKDDELGEEGVEYEEDPNEKFLNYETTYNSLLDEKFEVFNKTNFPSPQEAYSEAFTYILTNLI